MAKYATSERMIECTACELRFAELAGIVLDKQRALRFMLKEPYEDAVIDAICCPRCGHPFVSIKYNPLITKGL